MKFHPDILFYLRTRHFFTFDGKSSYVDKRGRELISYSKDGIDGIAAFNIWDSQGKIKPTRHPNILKSLIRTKGSVNLHIKMYAEDRARGYLPKVEFQIIVSELNLPQWFSDAVENQKHKYYE